MRPIVLIFGFLLCRTKCECVRRSLLGGSAAKMGKTACKVLLFVACFSLEGRVRPWKQWAVDTSVLKSHFHPQLVVPLVGEPEEVPCRPGSSSRDLTFAVKIENVFGVMAPFFWLANPP